MSNVSTSLAEQHLYDLWNAVIGEKGKMTPRADYVMHRHMCE